MGTGPGAELLVDPQDEITTPSKDARNSFRISEASAARFSFPWVGRRPMANSEEGVPQHKPRRRTRRACTVPPLLLGFFDLQITAVREAPPETAIPSRISW